MLPCNSPNFNTFSSMSDSYGDRVLSFSEVDGSFISPTYTLLSQGSSCPSFGNLTGGNTIAVCPNYSVIEYDQHRSPATLIQVEY